MSIIKSFDDFLITESLIEGGWPLDWKSMPEWKTLEEMGYVDTTTKIQAKNQTIMINNPNIPLYPAGIVIQKSGYIRDKAARSGYIRKFFEKPYSLKMMFDYIIKISTAWLSKRTRSERHGQLTDQEILLLADAIKTEKWGVNPETNMIDVQGSVNLSTKPWGTIRNLKFGYVKGDFTCTRIFGMTDLRFAPEKVGGSFNCSDSSLQTLEGSPKIVNGDFNCSYTNIQNLVGCPNKVGGEFVANTPSLISLEGIIGKDIKGGFSCKYFEIPSVNPQYLQRVLNGETWKHPYSPDDWTKNSESNVQKARELVLPVMSEEYLDEYFIENPLDLYFLDDLPEIKKGVLKRTGIKDLSVVGRNLRSGII